MPRLYREAPLNSIWEGSGNVNALDVLRALARTPAVLDAYLAEVEPAARRRRTASTLRRRAARATSPTRRRGARAPRAAPSSAWRWRSRARCSCATRRARWPTPSAPSRLAGDGGLAFGDAAQGRRRPGDRRPPHPARGLMGGGLDPARRGSSGSASAPARAGSSSFFIMIFALSGYFSERWPTRRAPRPTSSRSPARRCSSSRCWPTSSATRSSPGATASGSRASTCGSSAAWRS